jgi:hypothetical protein
MTADGRVRVADLHRERSVLHRAVHGTPAHCGDG